MKFGDFLFPESTTPETDFTVINESLKEAELADQLGFHSIWLGEHHFDGACSYADPMAFAGAVVARTSQAKIGFSAVQTALHHPVRLAEQIALLDNLSNGRIIVGTARGTAFNFYEYRGYGIDAEEGRERLRETEEVLQKSWTGNGYKHEGKHWQLDIPVMRPKVVQQPHPPIIRAVATEASTIEMGSLGRPIMMVVQPNDVTEKRFELYKTAMAEAGYDDEAIANNMDNCWIWRNVFVADTDEEAERIAYPAYVGSRQHIALTRLRLNSQDEQESVAAPLDDPRFSPENALITGSPDTVAEKIKPLDDMGIGGLIIHFRIGAMTYQQNERSLRLFAEKVMPRFQG